MNVPVVGKSGEDAKQHFTWFTMFASMDTPASSAKTRERLDGTPEKRGLFADIEQADYCAGLIVYAPHEIVRRRSFDITVIAKGQGATHSEDVALKRCAG